LIAAGAYQWTPMKNACLRHCRSPLQFLLSDWKEGAEGAFRMGADHGLFCIGCCWMLMLLPFVAGGMNLSWMAGITVLVMLEKAAPRGDLMGRICGMLLALVGCYLVCFGAGL
jgi:predicted metal-binding membrane protein